MNKKSYFLIILLLTCAAQDVHVKNARRFIGQWNYDRALVELLKYRETPDAEVQYLIGVCYFGKNEYDQAKEHFKIALDNDTIFKDSIINVYNTATKKALAISDFKKALYFSRILADLIPDHRQADNLFLMADLNFREGDYHNALLGYLKAFDIDSTSEVARRSIKNFLRTLIACDSLKRAHALALKEYKKMRTSENLLLLGEINYLLGKKYFASNQYDSALIYFKEIAVSQEPKSLLDDSYFYIAEIFYNQENYSQALEYYKKVLRLNPYQKGELVQKAQARIKEIKEKQ
ncbi:MAG: tetratricopeptide repeat protein [candidate division WOR-3 bacterium]